MTDLEAQWGRVQGRLRAEFGDAAFNSWLKPLCLVNVDSGKVQIAAPTRFMRDWVQSRTEGRSADDLLMPPMHAARLKAQLNWPETAGGRTIHQARHTAICLWLAAGVSVEKVQAWAGHASIVTTNRYVTYLGQDDEDEIAKVVG